LGMSFYLFNEEKSLYVAKKLYRQRHILALPLMSISRCLNYKIYYIMRYLEGEGGAGGGLGVKATGGT
jgi:hypothetical protein